MSAVIGQVVSTYGTAASLMFASAAAVAAVVMVRFIRRRSARTSRSTTVSRRRSTTIGSTKLMASGVLPKDSGYDSIINCALWFDRLPQTDEVKAIFRDHIAAHQRFHCVPHQSVECGPIDWVCKRVEIERHVFVRVAPMRQNLEFEGFANNGEGAVRREIEGILNTSLKTKEEGRPWWEVHIIESPSPSASSAGDPDLHQRPAGMILVRMHHALGDGVSLMEMFSDVLLDSKGTPLSSMNLFAPSARGARASWNPWTIVKFAFSAVKSFFHILALASVGMDTPCSFQNSSRQLPYQPNRFTVYLPSHSLALIKRIKDGLSSNPSSSRSSITVNDVEFALFAGMIRRFLIRHGEDPSHTTIRALTPFAMMEKACPDTKYQTLLRNYWTFVVNELPVKEASTTERIKNSHSSWSRLKETALIPVSFFVHRLNSHLPAAMQKQTSNELMKRLSVVFSNVPGPQATMFFAGEQIGAVHMLFPNISQQVGILSLDGMIHVALVMSTSQDHGQTRRWLAECFLEELKAAAAAVGVSSMDVMKQVRLL